MSLKTASYLRRKAASKIGQGVGEVVPDDVGGHEFVVRASEELDIIVGARGEPDGITVIDVTVLGDRSGLELPSLLRRRKALRAVLDAYARATRGEYDRLSGSVADAEPVVP